jgi:hypothetical protein
MNFNNRLALEQNNSGTRRTGQQGRCINLNGTNQAVRVADNTDLDITDNLTVCVWAKNNNALLGSTIGILNKGDLVNKREWYFGLNVNEKIVVAFGDSDGAFVGTKVSDDAPTLNEFNHYVFTFYGGVVEIYLNGVNEPSTTTGAIPANLNNEDGGFSIGGLISSGVLQYFWDGQVFDARIYAGDSTVLTAAQILSIYQDGINNVEFAGQSLRAHYKLDEQSGTICYDSSGNENHGTIENAVSNWGVTQDVMSFQNQVGYAQRIYFNGVDSFVNGLSIDATDCEFYLQMNVAFPLSQGNSPINSLRIGNNFVRLAIGGTAYNWTPTFNPASKIWKYRFKRTGDDVEFFLDDVSYGVLTVSGNITYDKLGQITSAYYVGTAFNFKEGGVLKYKGYGNTDADWTDQIGSDDGTVNGSPSILYLPRDESDPTNDVLGNPLTYTGTRPNDASLINSSCLTLNGTNQAVRVADNTALDITDNLSAGAWVKNSNSSIPASNTIFSKYDVASKREFSLYYNTSEQLGLALGNPGGGGSASHTSNSALSVDSWNHVFFTFENGSVILYVNGQAVSSTASGTHVKTLDNEDADFTIGALLSSNALADEWDGQIFDTRIYAGDSTVLTAAQILSIYEDGINNVEFAGHDLRARYVCAEGEGTAVLDSSGNENHGIIENAASNWGVTQDVFHANLLNGHSKRMWFDGVNAYINIPYESVNFGSSDFEIEASVYIEKIPVSGSACIIALYDGTSNQRCFIWRIGSDGKLVIVTNSTGEAVDNIVFEGSTVLIARNKYKLKVEKSGTSVRLYINDILDGEGTAAGAIFSPTILTKAAIGAIIVQTGVLFAKLTGTIYDLTVVTNSSLTSLYQGYGNADADWIDTSGNGNNGTVVGSPEIIRIPASSATAGLDALGNDLQFPAGSKFIPAETEINFNPDSTPEMGSTQLGFTVPAAHEFGDVLPSYYKMFSRKTDTSEDRFTVFKDALYNTDLTRIRQYTGKTAYPLDDFKDSIIGAWSTRRLFSDLPTPSYILKGRDGTTNTLDFAEPELSGGILSLANGGNAFVPQLYDQSGNGNHATQTVAASQPKLVDAGSLIVDASGRPVMDFDTVDDTMTMGVPVTAGTSDVTFAFKASTIYPDVVYLLRSIGGSRVNITVALSKLKVQLTLSGFGNFKITSTTDFNDGNLHLGSVTLDRDGFMRLYFDGSLEGSIDISAGSAVNFILANQLIISQNSPQPMQIAEIMVFDSVLTQSEITQLHNALA